MFALIADVTFLELSAGLLAAGAVHRIVGLLDFTRDGGDYSDLPVE